MPVIALALREGLFGNPVIEVDERFYGVAGERRLAGAVPFVTIRDRGPVDLFVLYAALRRLSGPSAAGYPIAAMLSAAATATVILSMVGNFTDAP